MFAQEIVVTPFEHRLSRAHRRFLGLTVPLPSADEHSLSLQAIEFVPGSRRRFAEHLATAGAPRSGLLIGHRSGDRVHVQAILGRGYGWPTAQRLQVDAHYALGAVEAAQQLSGHPMDWVGTWCMPADGRARPAHTDRRIWHRARHLALVSEESVLVTIGHSPERLVLRAWIEEDGQPRALEVVWASAGGGS